MTLLSCDQSRGQSSLVILYISLARVREFGCGVDGTVGQLPVSAFISQWLRIRCRVNRQITGNSESRGKRERRSVTSQAPPLLRQRKPYLTGSPPSRQERRYRQECRMVRL